MVGDWSGGTFNHTFHKGGCENKVVIRIDSYSTDVPLDVKNGRTIFDDERNSFSFSDKQSEKGL